MGKAPLPSPPPAEEVESSYEHHHDTQMWAARSTEGVASNHLRASRRRRFHSCAEPACMGVSNRQRGFVYSRNGREMIATVRELIGPAKRARARHSLVTEY